MGKNEEDKKLNKILRNKLRTFCQNKVVFFFWLQLKLPTDCWFTLRSDSLKQPFGPEQHFRCSDAIVRVWHLWVGETSDLADSSASSGSPPPKACWEVSLQDEHKQIQTLTKWTNVNTNIGQMSKHKYRHWAGSLSTYDSLHDLPTQFEPFYQKQGLEVLAGEESGWVARGRAGGQAELGRVEICIQEFLASSWSFILL